MNASSRCRFGVGSIPDLVAASFLMLLLLLGTAVTGWCQTETVIHSFGSTPADGFGPAGGLLEDAAGNLYGTTSSGSQTPCDGNEVLGCGIVFELVKSSSGFTEKILYTFGTSSPVSDGVSPMAGVIMDGSGNLFGTTAYGGSFQCTLYLGSDGCGTVFELVKSSSGYTENVIYTFTGPDGEYPEAGLIMDTSGNLFGTTSSGGACGLGTAFELVKSSGAYTEKVLYSFGCAPADGWNPYAGVIADATGTLYGAAESAGDLNACGGFGCGLVFELVNSSGEYSEKILYDFTGSDGELPSGNLIFDSAGNLYGTTQEGGADGDGTIFQLASSSSGYTESVLYSFRGPNENDGQNPIAGLIIDSSGNLYGTTQLGGSGCVPQGCGIVFELVNSAGAYSEKILHAFGAPGDGVNALAPLILDSAGNLYGTTSDGGSTICSCGAVFEINPSATAPAQVFSLLALAFNNQPLNVPSPPQTLTITNTGSANLIFASNALTVTGQNSPDFVLSSNTCSGKTVLPEASCSVTVIFTPSILGAEAATLTVVDNASAGPQNIGLSGIGVTPPAVMLSPSSLTFSSEAIGSASSSQVVTLANTGGGQLTISNISVSTGFGEAPTCGSTLAGGASCTISVQFVPDTTGPISGTLMIADNAANSPQTVALSGTGTGPVASVAPASLAFGGVIFDDTSSAQQVTISNIGNANLTISSLSILGANAEDFAIVSNGTTCMTNTTLMPQSSCAANVTYTPTASGMETSSLMIYDNSDNQTDGSQSVALSGSGEDFALQIASGSSPSATVIPGATASYSISIVPVSGFDQTVMLSCSGAPAEASCLVTPNSVFLSNGSASTATVTVTTTASGMASGAWLKENNHGWPVHPDWLTFSMTLAGCLGVVIFVGRAALRQQRHNEINQSLRRTIFAGILASATMLASCGSGNNSNLPNSGAQAGTYSITVKGTSGNLSQSMMLRLIIE